MKEPGSLDSYRLAQGPTFVIVETTRRCNLKCKMCGHSSPNFVLPRRADISMEAIDNLQPILHSAQSVWLSGYGEPLMHPRIFDIIAQVKSCNANLQVGFTTNATLLSRPSFIERLIESRLDILQVSFEGYDNDFGHQAGVIAMRNLRTLCDRKSSLGVCHPKIEIGTVLMRDSIGQLKQIVDEAVQVGGETFIIRPLKLDSLCADPAPYVEQDVYANKALVLPIIHEAVEYGKSRGLEIIYQFMDEDWTIRRRKCTYPFWFFYVSCDGRVCMCCNGHFSGENLNRKNAWDIWNGEAYRELRYRVDTENYDRRCWECPLFQPPVEDEGVLKQESSLLSKVELVEYVILQKRYIREAHRRYDALEGQLAFRLMRQMLKLPGVSRSIHAVRRGIAKLR